MGAGLTFTVAITSLNRPDELEKCLQAVAAMDRMPDNLLVALHREDHASTEVASAAGADVFYVEAPGLAVAVEAAIRHATNDVVCFVDDDARPHPDWLDRIANHFESDEKLGFLGGRDNVDGDCESGAESLLVGRITATGKVVGNHHLGKGESRRADLLKGANMSVRRTPAVNIPLGQLVTGPGAQFANEMFLSLGIRNQGYFGRYDPQVQVDHFPASRQGRDGRRDYSRERVRLNVRNQLTSILLYGTLFEATMYCVRAIVAGNNNHPGIIWFLIQAHSGPTKSAQRLLGSLSGLRDAFADLGPLQRALNTKQSAV